MRIHNYSDPASALPGRKNLRGTIKFALTRATRSAILWKALAGIPLYVLVAERSANIRSNSHELLDDDLRSRESRTKQRISALQVEQPHHFSAAPVAN